MPEIDQSKEQPAVIAPARFVDVQQILHKGEPMMLIRDPEGLLEEPILISLPMFIVLSMLDGERDIQGVQAELTRLSGGQIIPTDDISQIVDALDECFLLHNERSMVKRREILRHWNDQPTRPASHAGAAYPGEAGECRTFFDELFHGLARDHEAAGGRHPRGLIVPHIDFRVGGRAIARGLARLDAAQPADLYVILGVAHQPTQNLFTLTDKPFETPLGLVETDRDAAAKLVQLYGADRLDGSFGHRYEHSVEFAAVGLRHWHGPEAPFKILPVLCSSMMELMMEGAPSPMGAPLVSEFIGALRRLIEEYPGRVCVIASVDLSHVGMKFGDERGVDELRAQTIRAADEKMLASVLAHDPEAFFETFKPDHNARNVDAVTAVYVMLHALAKGEAEQVVYEQWKEEPTDSMVTYASLAIY